ncbi:MAG: 30S ribosomal protein S6 [Alphaproteobacteria bacterium]
MPLYECVTIARQDISSAQVDALNERFSTVITENGGSVANLEYWGLKNLTYKINKNRKGHYVLMQIDAPSDAVKEMERQMRLDEDMMRYLTLRVEEFEELPSVQMRNRNTRDRNDRGGDRNDRGGDRNDRGGDRNNDRREPRAESPKTDSTEGAA